MKKSIYVFTDAYENHVLPPCECTESEAIKKAVERAKDIRNDVHVVKSKTLITVIYTSYRCYIIKNNKMLNPTKRNRA